MKTIKKFAMSLLGGGIAVAALAFTLMSAGVSESHKLADSWYEFTPGSETPDPLNPSQYTHYGATPPAECEDGSTICAIRVPDGQTLNADLLETLEENGDMSGQEGNENVKFKL